MTHPTARNRLDEAASPYLRQHADNPVNWQPWGEPAFSAAREHDVPIFLSIGYSACHWCHVMAEESFADPEIAAVLNEQFVPVKVDREQRPDVDDLYMTVSQVTRGSGGWPLSVFLTPERKPFYITTYVPKEPTRDQPGFESLLEDVTANWRENRGDLDARAEQWLQAARGELESVPDPVDDAGTDSPLPAAAGSIADAADATHGGFGRGQKFPHAGRLRVLLRATQRDAGDGARAASAARHTLTAMADGGLHDHVGGGFHRYCTDREWTVPHFEKMLYDQAALARLYVDGYRALGDSRYADVARSTLTFVDRELGHPDGGFYATLDARSPPPDAPDGDREEGAYYVWTPDRVAAAMRDHAAAAPCDTADADVLVDAACRRYGIDDTGNFEGGTTVPTVSASVGAIADAFDTAPATAEAWCDVIDARLRAARADRPRPARDEKVLAGWNGLMARAYAEAGLALDDRFAERAADAIAFARDTLWDGDRLARRSIGGDVAGVGYAADYAFLAAGALATYEATGAVAHLDFALDLADAMLEACYDASAGVLYETPASVDDVAVRSQATGTGSTPSPVGVAADTLDALAAFAPAAGYDDAAAALLSRYGSHVEESPGRHPELVLAADTRAGGRREITVAADDLPDAWRDAVGAAYLPDRLLSRRPPTEDGLDAWQSTLDQASVPPLWAGRTGGDDGTPRAYVCRRACSPPLGDAAGITEWLAEFSR
ncbi:thioredoxin domain-containing protein [Halobacterium sp. BOL4-2]|uniref:thioredoxin domain-containing protein n=1 Tax=Halobacterium sp. BOL4-2 TaxID=2810537 RepID=UPI0019640146|nr:thioredoxin domain-containing protein [Halobacterium sp. BOL4-2]QRY25777.1 thioredoxin domain-containing protein [Halobacterium sp. BOL4-2]